MEYITETINISKIKEGFFIGDRMAGTNLNVLLQFKISHMINAAGNQIINQFQTLGIRTLTLNWTESQNQKLLDSKDEIPNRLVSFIDDAIKNGEGLLAYSVRGQNRVCIVVILYLMRKYNWSLKKCITFLNINKKDIDIPQYFLKQLFEYEKRLINNNNNIQLSDDWTNNVNKNLDSDEFLIQNTYINSLLAKKKLMGGVHKIKMGKHVGWGDNNPYNRNSHLIIVNNNKNDLILQKNPKKIVAHLKLRPKKSCIKLYNSMTKTFNENNKKNFEKINELHSKSVNTKNKNKTCELNKLISFGMDVNILNKYNEINNNFSNMNLVNKNINNKSLNTSLKKKNKNIELNKQNNINVNKQNNINININVNHSLINNDNNKINQTNPNITDNNSIFNNLINIPISMNINSNTFNKKITNKKTNNSNMSNIRKKRSNTFETETHQMRLSLDKDRKKNFTKKLFNNKKNISQKNQQQDFIHKMNNSANNFYSNDNYISNYQNKIDDKMINNYIANNNNQKLSKNNSNGKIKRPKRSITPNNSAHNKNFLAIETKNQKNNYRLINEYINNIKNYNNYINYYTLNKKMKKDEENITFNESINNNSFLTNNKQKKIQNNSITNNNNNINYSYNYNLKLIPKNKKFTNYFALKKVKNSNMLNIPLDNGNPIKLNDRNNQNKLVFYDQPKKNFSPKKKNNKMKRPNTADQKENDTMKNSFNSGNNWFKSITEICGNSSQGFYKNKNNSYVNKYNKRAPSPMLQHKKNNTNNFKQMKIDKNRAPSPFI